MTRKLKKNNFELKGEPEAHRSNLCWLLTCYDEKD